MAALLAGSSLGVLAALVGAPRVFAADVNITTDQTSTVLLDGFAGTTAQVNAGVSVTNPTFTTLCPTTPVGSFTGGALCASTHAWAVTNFGTIGPANFGEAIHFIAGGSVDNFGTVTSTGNGISIDGGASASVTNEVGALITATGANPIVIGANIAVAGTVTNYGTITGAGQAMTLWSGGSVTNALGASIIGHGGSNAIGIILGTSRSVTNDGLIQSNDSGFGTGISIDPGTVTNHLTGQILGAYNAIWSHSGGATTINNDGLLEAKLAAGGGASIEMDGGGTVNNTGTIRSIATDTSDAGVWGRAATTINNSGTIESTSGGLAIKFSGAALHTVNLDTGSILVGNVQGGTGIDALTLNGTGTEAISKFLSFETLTMQGTNWTVTGNGTFSTSSTISSGALHVNGQLTSPAVTIANGGTLAGTGTVVGTVTNNGNIAPGNSIGTLTINGNYTQSAGSTYTVEVSTAASDRLNVIGNATIQAGTTVSVLPAAGLYTVGQQYTILNATGGVTGTYTTLTDNAPFVDFSLTYDPNNVFLNVTATGVPFTFIAQTPNQAAAAGALQALGSGPAFNVVMLLSGPAAQQAFDQLSGEIHASLIGSMLDVSRPIRAAAFGRLHQAAGGTAGLFAPRIASIGYGDEASAYAQDERKPVASPIDRALAASASATTPVTAWGQAFGEWGRADGDGNAASLRQKTGGFILGADVPVGGDWRAGIAGGYQRTFVNSDDRGSSGTIDGYHVMAYGGTHQGPVGLGLGAAYTFADISTSRTIAFPGFADAAAVSYGGGTAQVFGELTYDFSVQMVALEPFADLAYVNVHTNGFTESGGAASLTGTSNDVDTTYSTLGLRVAAPLPADVGLTATGTLGWRHAFSTVQPATQLEFNAGGGPFTVQGTPISRDAVLIEAGLVGRIASDRTLSVTYTGQLGDHAQEHAVTLEFVQRF